MRLGFSDLTGKIYTSKKEEIENFPVTMVRLLTFHNGKFIYNDKGYDFEFSMKVTNTATIEERMEFDREMGIIQ